MGTPSENSRFPDHIAAIVDRISPQDIMKIIAPVGYVLGYFEGRNPDATPAISLLRTFMGRDADVLLEWLGVEIDETAGPGVSVSIRSGTDLDGVEARAGRFLSNL